MLYFCNNHSIDTAVIMSELIPYTNYSTDGSELELNSQDGCLLYLEKVKWEGGFICKRCGHTNYCKGKTVGSRRCTKCKKEESATAHTPFHRCHLPLPEAFRIAKLVCSNPNVSSYSLSDTMEIRQMTCWRFKKKIMDCLKSHDPLALQIKEGLDRNILDNI